MSGRTEIVYEEDKDIDIEEFKLEPIAIDQQQSEPMNFSCNQCDYSGVSLQALKLHKSLSHYRKLSCTQCGFVAHKQSSLMKHKNLCH